MKKLFLILIAFVASTACFAIDGKTIDHKAYKQLLSQQRRNEQLMPGLNLSTNNINKVKRAEENVDEEFIFDPQGEEKTYVMSLYSYDQTNSKFVSGQSLYSRVRYAEDGKTVYFKHLTKSLGVKTWVKGVKRVMDKDSLEVGISKGDTIIDIPYGQPLAYYKNKYVLFFCPMDYDDNTGNMVAEDNYTLIQRGDSLVQPTYAEGHFQAAAGYVVVSENTQGTLSLDIDHAMRLESKPFAVAPADVEPVDYVYTLINSYGNVYKKKTHVKKQGDDLYMQLSTSAPDAYIKGTIKNGEIEIENGQVITDSTFIYYYSLADPVYVDDQIDDFVPTKVNRLGYDEQTRTIAPLPADGKMGGVNTFSVDYLDGMTTCMDYVTNPVLEVYPGDVLATPLSPTIRSVNLDGGMMELSSGTLTFNYMSFVVPALDVDGNYINNDLMSYRLYVNDELYTFSPSTYRYVSADMTNVPYSFDDGYDFRSYDQLKYIYLYFEKDQVNSLGVQSVYTVNGEEKCSEIATVRFDNTDDPDDTRKDDDLTLSCRLVDNMVKAGEQLTLRGMVKNSGKNPAVGYAVSYTVNGETTTKQYTNALSAGKTSNFDITFTAPETEAGKAGNIDVKLAFMGDTNDENADDNAASLTYGIYAESTAEPNLLVEEFTAESCGWCPYGAWRIKTAIDEAGFGDRVHWICHHEGFGVDWLTVDESTTYTELYGGSTFAPAWMVNRNQRYGDEDYPVFGIPEVSDVKDILTEALQTPCFVGINIENTYADGTMDITVNAEKSELFDVQCAEPRVTVFIVENDIPAQHQKTYDSHTIANHHNALRAVLSNVWGDEITWSGNKAEMKYQFAVPADYVAENVKVVAFVHENNADVNQRRVFNSALANLSDTMGIDEVHGSVDNGRDDIYNLAGQRLSRTYKGLIIQKGRKGIVK